MSLQVWQNILQEEQISSNRQQTAAVIRVGNAISSILPPEAAEDWEFRLFASDRANAFCLPGGKIGVYEGIFRYTKNDAELAAVIAHEIGHAIARHGGERMTQAMLFNLGSIGLALALHEKEAQERQKWLLAYTGVTTLGVLLPFSRMHEYAADEIGLIYMARAGYNPEAALSFWGRFASQDDGLHIELLSTHPLGEKRRNRLHALLPQALVEYELASVRRGLGEIYD